MKTKYKQLLKEKNFVKLTLATFITRIGDGIDMIAFSWLVYEVSGSTALVATIFAVNMIPNITFGIIAGAVCKYINEKTVMLLCDFGRALGVIFIALLYMSGYLEVWHLFVITFLNSTFESFRSPAQTSIFPKILEEEKREEGLAIQQAIMGIANLIGLACGPLCIALFGLGGAVVIDGVTFLLCGAIIFTLRHIDQTQSDEGMSVHGYIQDLKDGFRYTRKDKLLINICIFAFLVNAMVVPIIAFEAPFMKDYLHVGSEGIAIFGVGQVLGMIVFSPLAPLLKEKICYRNMFILGGVLAGLGIIAYAFTPMLTGFAVYVALGLGSFFVGSTLTMVNFPIQLAMYGRVEQAYLSRFSSLMMAFCMAAQPLAAMFFGALVTFVKLDIMYVYCGIAVVLIFATQIFNTVLVDLNKY